MLRFATLVGSHRLVGGSLRLTLTRFVVIQIISLNIPCVKSSFAVRIEVSTPGQKKYECLRQRRTLWKCVGVMIVFDVYSCLCGKYARAPILYVSHFDVETIFGSVSRGELLLLTVLILPVPTDFRS